MQSHIALALALLTASLAVPLASAGLVDDGLPAEAACDINQPIVDYVICRVNEGTGEVVQRLKDEAAWQEATARAAATYYNGVGTAVASSTFDFEGRQISYTTAFVWNTQTNTYGYVNYVYGVPFSAVAFTDGVVEGECTFWISSSGCPVFVTSSESSTVALLDGEACPTTPMLAYVLCTANNLIYEIGVIADQAEAHYTDVAFDTANYALVTGLTAYSRTYVFAVAEGVYVLVYGLQTANSALTYAGDVMADTSGVPGYTRTLVYAECGRIYSQCPVIITTITPALPALNA